MRKIIGIFISFALLFSMCACSAGNSKETAKIEPTVKKETIQLTSSNFEDYFSIECIVTNFSKEKISILNGEEGKADCEIIVKQIKPGTLSDVKVTIRAYSYTLLWQKMEEKSTIVVPISGNASKSFSCTSDLSVVPGMLREPELYNSIVEVSGTITVSD